MSRIPLSQATSAHLRGIDPRPRGYLFPLSSPLFLRPLHLSLVPFLSPSLSLVAAAMQPSVPPGNVIQWKAKRNIVLLRLLDSKEYGQSHRGKRVQNAICYSKKYDWRGRTLELESIRREAKEKGRMKIRRFHVWCAG